ncbi:MAG: serine dehydratase subunit alpha family protein, partial [Erysipelotrichia bacterium]|nr:serine dehydratase subunit alpha family protein [Erysipelotrichia bacterium]
MDRTELFDNYAAILNEELIPAFGCTEPIAIAFCAARAKEVLGCIPDRVKIEVSGNIVKNVKSVVVPNTGGQKGIETAAAAGIIAGDPALGLEAIASVTDAQKEQIREYRRNTEIKVLPMNNCDKLDILITEYAKDEQAAVRISGRHTSIVYISRNDKVLLDLKKKEQICSHQADRSCMSVDSIVDYARHGDLSKVKAVLDRQIDYNLKIAEEGINGSWGANIGSVLLAGDGDSLKVRAKAMA